MATLEVRELQYIPEPGLLSSVVDSVRRQWLPHSGSIDIPLKVINLSFFANLHNCKFVDHMISQQNKYCKLKGVSFSAQNRNITAIISSNDSELRTVAKMVGRPMHLGTFDGTVTINGLTSLNTKQSIGFVTRVGSFSAVDGYL
jgi:hypothetical protein